jgi:hypothetical protein
LLNEVGMLAAEEEEQVGDRGPFDARDALAFLIAVNDDLKAAAVRREEGPDPAQLRREMEDHEAALGSVWKQCSCRRLTGCVMPSEPPRTTGP